jgi:hypothetical protein
MDETPREDDWSDAPRAGGEKRFVEEAPVPTDESRAGARSGDTPGTERASRRDVHADVDPDTGQTPDGDATAPQKEPPRH